MARTTALNKIERSLYEPTFYKVIQGGQGAGKTYAVMTLLIGYAMSYSEALVSVVGMSYRHLDQGAIRDFKSIMKEARIWEAGTFNGSKNTYTFPNGSVIEFLSSDNMSARGPRRDVLFVNEINGSLDYETFGQLSGRTNDFVIVDYNPSAEFFIHTKIINDSEQSKRTTFMILTYRDNEALSNSERDYIESRAPKKGEKPSNWYRVYGMGLVGSLEGNIYSGWLPAERPETARLVRYGLDFGFSNDETGLVGVWETEDGGIWVEELVYEKGLLGSQYGERLKAAGVDPSVLIVADSARPEIIAEIKRAGFRCVGAEKGAGSVKRGIDRVCQRKVLYGASSKDLEREYLTYAWRKKKSSGETIDEPQDGNDHLMDALRYAVDDMSRQRFDF